MAKPRYRTIAEVADLLDRVAEIELSPEAAEAYRTASAMVTAFAAEKWRAEHECGWAERRSQRQPMAPVSKVSMDEKLQAALLRLGKPTESVFALAARRLLTAFCKANRNPDFVDPTADGGVAFYFTPDPTNRSIYTCIEIFPECAVVAAYSEGCTYNLGIGPDPETIASFLDEGLAE